MTREEAIKLVDLKIHEMMTHRQIAEFQLHEDRLCMPFDVFHEALEKTLGQPVWTHELWLNPNGLKQELMGGKEPPTMQEIIELIPKDKRIILGTLEES